MANENYAFENFDQMRDAYKQMRMMDFFKRMLQTPSQAAGPAPGPQGPSGDVAAELAAMQSPEPSPMAYPASLGDIAGGRHPAGIASGPADEYPEESGALPTSMPARPRMASRPSGQTAAAPATAKMGPFNQLGPWNQKPQQVAMGGGQKPSSHGLPNSLGPSAGPGNKESASFNPQPQGGSGGFFDFFSKLFGGGGGGLPNSMGPSAGPGGTESASFNPQPRPGMSVRPSIARGPSDNIPRPPRFQDPYGR